MRVFLSLVFLLSVLAGESLCCDGGSLNEKSSYSHNYESHESSLVSKNTNFIEHEHSEDHEDSDHHRQCVGCSHSPFVKIGDFLPYGDLKRALRLSDINRYLPYPFLDGPFQPPKSNA